MADRALLEQIYEEEGISVTESPSGAAYAERLWEALADLFGIPSALLESLVKPSEIVLWVLVFAIPAGLLWVFREPLKRVLFGRAKAAPTVLLEALPAPPPDPRALLDARLAAGDGPGALKALWLMVARELAAVGLGRFDVEMTNREFVGTVRSARPEWSGLSALTTLARSVDRLLYGGVDVGIEQVRPLVTEANSLLGSAGPTVRDAS